MRFEAKLYILQVTMISERDRKKIAKTEKRLEEESEAVKKVLSNLDADGLMLPQPLPEGYIPNAKFEAAMKSARERVRLEQERTRHLLDELSELPLPAPIKKG